MEEFMQAVNMLQAKSTLSRLVDAIEQGQEREIVIVRNGRPAAKLVPMDVAKADRRSQGIVRGAGGTTMKWRSCSWGERLESLARHPCGFVGDHR
jgi:prevent-host-death family protein